MSQRMAAVDEQFRDDQRLYLFVSHRFFTTKQIYPIKEGVLQYKCNLFLHFFLIMKLLSQSRFIYFHSLQNVLPVFPCLKFLKANKKLVLDIHGVVPEEHEFAGQQRKSRFYAMVESYLFRYLSVGISVTDAMSNHFREKYPSSKVRLISYPIMPSNIMVDNYEIPRHEDGDKIHIVYSGNLQSWQNIDLMIDVISKHISPDIIYTILTGSLDQMKTVLAEKGLSDSQQVFVDSVAPNELHKFYEKAHYGFILRDDITVNRVACPTKLVEYMFYGMIPIIKSKNIGDFDTMGYDYLSLEDFSLQALKAQKSKKNIGIISSLKDKSEGTDIREYLLNEFESN